MLNIFKTKGMPLGLDLSDVSLRIVQLGHSGEGGEIQAISEVAIPKGAFLEREFKQPDVLVSTIKKALSRPDHGKVTTDEVVAALPETKSFVRVIEMPWLSHEEAEEAIPWEAEQYVPLPIGQVYLDWVILGSASSEEKMRVLLTAAPREYVDQYTEVLKAAGLRPVVLEVESQSTARALVSEKGLESVVLIVDMGTHFRTSFIIYDRGTLHFTSSVPAAGKALTEAVARAKGVKAGEAEKFKDKHGLDEEGDKEVRKAMLPVINDIAEEILNTIRFYEEHSGTTDKIDRVILTGGSSKLKHLPSYLSEQLKKESRAQAQRLRSVSELKLELGNPWVNVVGRGETPPLSRQDSQGFTTAIGLALRSLEEK